MKCRECDVNLTDENWHKSNQKQKNYICKEHYNQYKRELKREHSLGIKRRPAKEKGFIFYPNINGELIVKIPLTQGKYARVDIQNADKFSKYQWHFDKGYAKRKLSQNKHISMHHDVIGKIDGLIIDHINGNRLYNCENNLRHVTYRENSQNHANANYSSRYPGVCYVKSRDKWQASIRVNGEFRTIGRYDTEEIAYEHYLDEVNKIQ
jgi:hypothetical protein